jgi:hypothetical protein
VYFYLPPGVVAVGEMGGKKLKNPCFKCTERWVDIQNATTCHSQCERRKIWEAWWGEAQKERRKQEEGIKSVIYGEIDMHYKMLKRKR